LVQEFTRLNQTVTTQLEDKATVESLADLEQKLLDKLNELFQAFVLKFSEKQECKRMVKDFEK
jgi:poly(A) polymerase Pap1